MIICVYYILHAIYYTSHIIILARLTSKEIKQVLALCRVSFKDRVAARRSVEEGEILKKEQKCKVCILFIISHIIEVQGVCEQPD